MSLLIVSFFSTTDHCTGQKSASNAHEITIVIILKILTAELCFFIASYDFCT